MLSLTKHLHHIGPMGFSLVEKLLQNPNTLQLGLINTLLAKLIPFNAPHGLSIEKCSLEEVVIVIPNKRANRNHLGGVHACAIATLGEFCSGLLLLNNLNLSDYRIILSKLQVEYHYQGRSKLRGVATVTAQEVEHFKTEIKQQGKILVQRTTEIYDVQKNHIATVTADWQLKSWKQVQTKTS